MNEKIVEQIEKVLQLENVTSEGFSRILFGFGGLFPQLGPTEAERRIIVETDLFKRANRRLTELTYREAYGENWRSKVRSSPLNGAVPGPNSESTETSKVEGRV